MKHALSIALLYLASTLTSQPCLAEPAALQFDSVRTALDYSCAIDRSGSAYCWGANDMGQLGTGIDSNFISYPMKVVGELRFRSLSIGYDHSCGITLTDELYCWGSNAYWQLANDSMAKASQPVKIKLAGPVASVDVGNGHTCAITKDQEDVYCWGRGDSGQLGNNDWQVRQAYPSKVAHHRGAYAIALGAHHSCFINDSGVPYCFGDGSSGQLGHGSQNSTSLPARVEGMANELIVQMVAALSHTCILNDVGKAFCFGKGANGQLGTGGVELSSFPQPVNHDMPFSQLSAGGNSTCALSDKSRGYCWGDNSFNQLGKATDGASLLYPQPYLGDADVHAIAAGGLHSCLISPAGTVSCLGKGESGQLGNSYMFNYARPSQVNQERTIARFLMLYCDNQPPKKVYKTLVQIRDSILASSCYELGSRLLSITYLDLQRRGLENLLPLKFLTSLQVLLLQDNRITDTKPLMRLKSLKHLNLGSNPLEGVTDLRKIRSLEHLELYNTGISSIVSFDKLTRLSHLDLSGNDITDLRPIAQIDSLTSGVFYGNPIDKDSENCPKDSLSPAVKSFCATGF